MEKSDYNEKIKHLFLAQQNITEVFHKRIKNNIFSFEVIKKNYLLEYVRCGTGYFQKGDILICYHANFLVKEISIKLNPIRAEVVLKNIKTNKEFTLNETELKTYKKK